MNFLLIINLIYCSKNKKSNTISFSLKDAVIKNKLNRIKRSENQDNNFNNKKRWHHPTIILNPTSKCKENSKFQYYHFDLESLKYSTILNLSQYFYTALVEHPRFILRCKKIGLNSRDVPSVTMFKRFVLKFITNKDFSYRDTKGNKFIQSIAWLAHKHIVPWSQTHLTRYMRNKWSILWQNIINSIHITTDSYCYWRVEFLFDGDKIAFANKQLKRLENGEISRPTLYSNNTNYSYNQYAIESFIDSPSDQLIN